MKISLTLSFKIGRDRQPEPPPERETALDSLVERDAPESRPTIGFRGI